MVTRYRSGWDYESLNEFTLVYVARWRAKDGKRYASPFKTKDSAENRAKELRSQGNKEVSVTQDTLRGNIKFKSDNSPDIKGMQKEDVSKDGAYAIGMAKAKDMYNDEKPVDKKTITKAHDIAKAILRKEEVIVEFTSQQIKQAYGIANDPRYKQGNYDGAVKAIEKLAKGLSKHPDVANVLKRTNEDINERYSVKFSYSKGGKIANAYYDDKDEAEKFIKSVIAKGGKAIMTMEDVGDYLKSKLNSTQIQNIKKTWQTKKASDVTPAVKAMIKNMDIPTQLAIKQANIPHLSKLVEGKDDAYAIGMSVAKKKYNDEPPLDKKTIEKGHEIAKSILKKEDASKDAENIAKLRTRQMALQTKLRDLDVGDPKDKTPIAITKNDIENIQMKMDQIRSKTKKEEKIHPAKALIEKITAVQNKAKKTGMPYSVLKKVYNRGMAAWKGGHRPGTTPQQWAMARVNSFVTKSSGTWGGADKDLAKQVRGSKK